LFLRGETRGELYLPMALVGIPIIGKLADADRPYWPRSGDQWIFSLQIAEL
jgi:hypothetical protein